MDSLNSGRCWQVAVILRCSGLTVLVNWGFTSSKIYFITKIETKSRFPFPLSLFRDVAETQRYIINRVSYRYLDPEAAFQLLLFFKTQVTSGGILWSCFITLLCTWTIFAQPLYCLLCYAQFFHQSAKRFWQKHKLNFDLTPLMMSRGP